MKKIFLVMLAFSVLSLGMGKKPGKEPAAASEPEAAYSEREGLNHGAPDFTLKDLTGKDISLRDFKDKKAVLLVFWATWCVYCRQEIPDLIKLKEQYKDKNLEIFGVNIQEAPEKIKPFIDRNRINYPILLDTKGNTARAYEVQGIPANVLIDKKGNVVFFGSFGEELKKLIEKNN
ncbi:MAG: TlpA disulfide reductase family protein [Candidatus Firestonebacteria bacterium]